MDRMGWEHSEGAPLVYIVFLLSLSQGVVVMNQDEDSCFWVMLVARL